MVAKTHSVVISLNDFDVNFRLKSVCHKVRLHLFGLVSFSQQCACTSSSSSPLRGPVHVCGCLFRFLFISHCEFVLWDDK